MLNDADRSLIILLEHPICRRSLALHRLVSGRTYLTKLLLSVFAIRRAVAAFFGVDFLPSTSFRNVSAGGGFGHSAEDALTVDAGCLIPASRSFEKRRPAGIMTHRSHIPSAFHGDTAPFRYIENDILKASCAALSERTSTSCRLR